MENMTISSKKHANSKFEAYENEEFYATPDLKLATVMLQLGYKVNKIYQIRPGRYAFVFEKSTEFLADVDKFWNRELRLEPNQLFDENTSLKTRLNDYMRNVTGENTDN